MSSKLLSTTAVEIFPRSTVRKSFTILNEDSSEVIYVKRERAETPTVSATDHDLKIGPGGSMALNSLLDGTEAINDRWTAVAAANTPRVSFFDTEDVRR